MEVATAAATQQQQQQHYVNPAASATASTTVADTRVESQSNGISSTTISSKTMHHHHQQAGQAGTSSVPVLPATTSTKISSATPSNVTNSGHASSTNRHSKTSSNSTTSCQRLPRHSTSNSPGTPNRHVNFGGGDSAEEKKREKFLTAKYGAHQMALIRKRLRVEMWMYERLQELYGADDIEIDLDEVLDMDDESDRRTYISELLRIDGNHPCTKSERVNGFVGDLLEKVKTL